MELGEHNVRVNAILPGAVDGDRVQRVFQERALAAGKNVDEIKSIAMENQSLKYLVDPDGIAALAIFLASGAARSISGQTFRSTVTCSAIDAGRGGRKRFCHVAVGRA